MHVLNTYKFNESDDKNLSYKGIVDFWTLKGSLLWSVWSDMTEFRTYPNSFVCLF